MSQRISIHELREVTQPESVRGRANSEHWVADLYLRRLSPYLTRILISLKFSPNAVTWLMILTGLSAALTLLIPGMLGVVLALMLGQLQMLWDCCDGEIARWRNTQSPKGVFLDRVGHYLTESLIPVAFALRLSGWPSDTVTDWKLAFIGALISIMILLNKGFNDIVHVARAFAGLSKLSDSKESGAPSSGLLRVAKAPFRILAVQRLFHSVEMSIIIAIFGDNEELIRIGVYIALFVTVGHLVAILGSRKLDPR